MVEIIEKTRAQKENEFFFKEHTNMGRSDEFTRLIEYINRYSDIRIERVNYQSMEQLHNSTNYNGKSFNFRITHRDTGLEGVSDEPMAY